MAEARARVHAVPESPAQKAFQQARAALAAAVAKLGLGQVRIEEASCSFECDGHTVRARVPESGRAFLLGRDGNDTLYTSVSPGIFRSESGVIVVDFAPVVRREVEAMVRHLKAEHPDVAPAVPGAQAAR
jgi:hypothetical protein